MKKRISILISVMMLLVGCAENKYIRQADGIIIKLAKQESYAPATMKLQVCDDNIIRVIASADKNLFRQESLIIENKKQKSVSFLVKAEDDVISLSTDKILVKVFLPFGHVTFYDTSGRIILQERRSGGKILTPAQVMGEQTYHIQQVFESPADEAFYGLGQHQNDIMNYKGHNVDLWQSNMVAVVPFLVSSRNYGILWDNNSRTKFGDIREYQPLSSLTLYDKDGREGGLTAEYFRDSGFLSLLGSRVESVIAHENLEEQGGFIERFNSGSGSIRYSGEIQSDKSGKHTFRFYSSSYAKVWLDDRLVVDSWRQNWCPWTQILSLDMEKDKRYSLKIEWIPNGGYIGLRYIGPNEENENTISLYSQVGDCIDYYFIYGNNLDEVIKGYRQLTGSAPMMPKWAYGLWQCRERYQTQAQLLSVVEEFRRRQIPLDNIVQDWFYWPEDKWGDHDFDPARYPDPQAMVQQLHDQLNTHIMISVWPKFYVGTKNFEQFKNNGWLYMRNIEKQERDWVGRGYVSTFYDPYSSGARDLFWQQINDKLFSKGFDAWWLDSTEPDIHSNLAEPEYLLRIGPTALGTSARYRNTYSLMNAKGIYEGQRQSEPNQRIFILTRSAYAGQQRYAAATWSGDIVSRWYDFDAQISSGLNFCLSGIPYWTMDIGGFEAEAKYQNARGEDLDQWRELNTRWFQFGTFCPLFRVHGRTPYREIFNIAPVGHQAYESMLAYDKLRYRLMPYIYSLAGMVTHQDYTIMRALVMDFGYDTNVLNIDNQYMFGPALLINPVTEYKARSREVYLPAGADWYDFKTGSFYQDGQTILADAPYIDMPIFVKAGSIIPFGPEIQYSMEKPADPIRLFVYTGADAEFVLYEDENINYNYENGAFSTIKFEYKEDTRSLTIGARRGWFEGMLRQRTFEIVWITRDNPQVFDLERQPDESIQYDGAEIKITIEPN